MAYELWDHNSGNRLGAFGTEREALAVVAELAGTYRSARGRKLTWLSLLRTDVAPEQGLIAEGQALVDRALRAQVPEAASQSPRRAHRRRAAA